MNWDDAKYFLGVARSGQMLGAAKLLGVSQAKLSRRITSLEKSLDCRLFERSTSGCTLTTDGAALLEIATRVETEFTRARTAIKGQESHVSGTIRIGAPDGFGVHFLSPRLGLMSERFPDLNIQLVPVPRSFSLSQREADIAVMVGRPTKGRLRVRKLTDYSLGLYASKGYVRQNGRPKEPFDLSQHRLIGYVEDLIYSPELNYNREILRDWRSGLEIASALGQFEAVRSGAGIGMLHDFIASPCTDLVNLFPERVVQRTYWTVWHERMKSTMRVKAVVAFLDELVRAESVLFMRQ